MKKVVFLPSFTRSVHQLTREDKKRVEESLEKFNHFVYASQFSHGFRWKRLDSDLYEFRAGLRLRVIVKVSLDTYYLVIVADHDEIKRHLRNY